MLESLTRLMDKALSDDVEVYPGHGDSTTIAQERGEQSVPDERRPDR